MSETFSTFATNDREINTINQKTSTMSTETLKKLAGVFQEDFKKETGNPIDENKLGGELWYE